jgi:hypothetical protein
MWALPPRGSDVTEIACQNGRMVKKMNGSKSWMIEDSRFCSSMDKTKLEQELDGQK